MALCDYRLCDACGGKAFYDANLNYSEETGMPDYVGAWVVLCEDCAKTHDIVVVAKEEA